MRKILKLLIVLSIIATFAVFSVLCCCTASALKARFHKAAVCSHCHEQNSNGHPTDPVKACQNQLTNAEFSHGPNFSPPINLVIPHSSADFINNHHTIILPSFSLVYPPGSPPLGISLTPLYLRTFHLRV
jgi:hypothetical protein